MTGIELPSKFIKVALGGGVSIATTSLSVLVDASLPRLNTGILTTFSGIEAITKPFVVIPLTEILVTSPKTWMGIL